MDLGTNYYALVLIPLGVLALISIIFYLLGLRIYAAIGLGVLGSIITIVILHRFRFEDGHLINEPGNLYTSIYIISSIIIFIFIFCFTIFKYATKKFCCKEESFENLYNSVDSVNEHADEVHRIEHYQNDILGSTSEESSKFVKYKESAIVIKESKE